jgi:hypothetical protein
MKINIFFWGMEKIKQNLKKSLTKTTKNILFKIEHLIHLTKKEKNEFGFFCMFKCFYVHDKKLTFNK